MQPSPLRSPPSCVQVSAEIQGDGTSAELEGHKVRAWRFTGLKEDLNEAAGVPTRLERRVRAMACHGHVLLCGDQHGHVRAWDLSKSPAQGYNLAGDLAHADQAHSANVRALSVDTLTNVVYSAGDDRCVRAWAEAPNGGAPGDNYI